jgi:hypothetical protein
MKAALVWEGGAILDTSDVTYWALNPDFSDGDVCINAQVIDNDEECIVLEFCLKKEDVQGMLDAMKKYEDRTTM